MKHTLIVAMGIILLSCAGARPAVQDPLPPANDPSPESVAISVAEVWLAKVDAGLYFESWDDAAETFRAGVPKEGWPKRITRTRDPLGKVVSRKLLLAQYTDSPPNGPAGKYVYIKFETTFENRKGVETVTPMLDPDGKWRVSGYYVFFPPQ